MPPAGFETASERPQTLVLDRAANVKVPSCSTQFLSSFIVQSLRASFLSGIINQIHARCALLYAARTKVRVLGADML
jgi:hypothetical protein